MEPALWLMGSELLGLGVSTKRSGAEMWTGLGGEMDPATTAVLRYRGTDWGTFLLGDFLKPLNREFLKPLNREFSKPLNREFSKPLTREFSKPLTREFLKPLTREFLKPLTRGISETPHYISPPLPAATRTRRTTLLNSR